MSNAEITQSNEPAPQNIPDGFVFEDEHPQLKLPFTAVIGDRKLEGESLSITKAIVSGLLPPFDGEQEELVSLRFDFDGYSINMFIEAFVTKSGESDDPSVTLRFADPTGEHLAALRYILNSFLAGHVVNMGQLLGFTGPTVAKNPQKPVEAPVSRRIISGLRAGAVFLAGVTLVYAATTVVYNRLAFLYEANPVVLSVDGPSLRATAAGQITFINTDAAQGDVAYSILSTSGDLLSTQMPCDCQIVAAEGLVSGATVLAGDPILQLATEGAGLVGDATVSDEGMARIIAGDSAELEMANGSILPVTLNFKQTTSTGTGIAAKVVVSEDFESATTSGDVGRLRFRNSFAEDWLKPIGNTVGGLFGKEF